MIEFSNMDVAGFLPTFFDEADPDDAVKQIDKNYQHGGGWRDMDGWALDLGLDGPDAEPSLTYPGDAPLKLLSFAVLHHDVEPKLAEDEDGRLGVVLTQTGEAIALFEHEFVAVIQLADRSFRVARID